jgi:phosphatidylethanolamine/phosphatidyl-N-methylethanolamine N-methyltransferase
MAACRPCCKQVNGREPRHHRFFTVAEPSSYRHVTFLSSVPHSIETIYERLAPIYDLIYGVTLAPGRRHAMARLAPGGGESILELGVGTGLSALEYPSSCRVSAIDLSPRMLERARARFARHGVHHVTLCRMDAARLAFSDGQFDAVYAPYLINIVSDPLAVALEMLRVCRPGGRIVLLNHFEPAGGTRQPIDQFLGRLVSHIGVNWHVDLRSLLEDAGLVARSVERVNALRVSSVVVCYKR